MTLHSSTDIGIIRQLQLSLRALRMHYRLWFHDDLGEVSHGRLPNPS